MIETLRRLWYRIRGRRFWYVPYWQGRRPEYFDFDTMAECVGKGWTPLLNGLSTKLFKLGWNGGLLQVKEKFGTLRFYWSNNIQDPLLHTIADDVVEVAEWRSGNICEACGEYGKPRGKNWVVTRCDDCYNEEQRRDCPNDNS